MPNTSGLNLPKVDQNGESFLDLLVSTSLGVESELLARSKSADLEPVQQTALLQNENNTDVILEKNQTKSVDEILQSLMASNQAQALMFADENSAINFEAVTNNQSAEITTRKVFNTDALDTNTVNQHSVQELKIEYNTEQKQKNNINVSNVTKEDTSDFNIINKTNLVNDIKQSQNENANKNQLKQNSVKVDVAPDSDVLSLQQPNESLEINQAYNFSKLSSTDDQPKSLLTDDFINQLRDTRKSDSSPLGWLLKGSASNGLSSNLQTLQISSEHQMSSDLNLNNQQKTHNLFNGLQEQDVDKKSDRSFSEITETNGIEALLTKNTQEIQKNSVTKVIESSNFQNTQKPEMEKMVLDQVIREIRLKRANGQNDLYLHLNPPELGSLRVRIIQGPEGIVSQIQASTEQVRNLLQNHLPVLLDGLRQAGVNMDNVSITTGFDLGASAKDSAFTASQNQNQQNHQQRSPINYYGVLSAMEVGASSADQYNHSSGFNWFA